MRWRIVVCGALTLSAAGCASSLESRVRRRAAADFHCREQDLKIIDRQEPVFRVAGCGEEATYICSDSANLRTHCKRADWDQHETVGMQPGAAQPALQR
jgi:hypothetical protein